MNNDNRMIIRMVRVTKALFVACIVAMTCACNDFLTISPTDKIVLEDFWKSKEDVESVRNECYRLMTERDFTYRLLVWGEVRGDNVTEGNNAPDDITNILDANLLPTNTYTTWNKFYEVINNCNLVLKYAPDVLNEDPDFTQGDLDVARGEVLAIRALCHFYLVRTFRNIPLLTEAMVDNSQNLYQAQVTPIEALDCCLRDLYEAEGLVLTSGNLETTKSYANDRNNKGRITKDAVRTMIADVLLWKAAFMTYDAHGNTAIAENVYNECIKYCDLVINTRLDYAKTKYKDNKFRMPNVILNDTLPLVYPLESSYSGDNRFPHAPYEYMFASSCNHFYESIFEIQHDKTGNGSNYNYEVPYFYGSSPSDNNNFNPGVLSATSYLALPVSGLHKISDFRRINNCFSQSEGGKELDKYGIIKYGHMGATENRGNGYTFGKMSYAFLKSNGSYFSDNIVNWIVYRVSDVILMKAEALALRGTTADLDEAFGLVSAIYNRSQAFYITKDGIGGTQGLTNAADREALPLKRNEESTMLLLVMRERQREFAFEGKRWFDLVRYALYTSVDGTTTKMFADTKMLDNKYIANQTQYQAKMGTISSLFYPIAEREMDTNPLLVQNEAYAIENKYEKN